MEILGMTVPVKEKPLAANGSRAVVAPQWTSAPIRQLAFCRQEISSLLVYLKKACHAPPLSLEDLPGTRRGEPSGRYPALESPNESGRRATRLAEAPTRSSNERWSADSAAPSRDESGTRDVT